MNIFKQLYNLFMWKRKHKKRLEKEIRAALPDMRKQTGQMAKLGGKLRLRQMQGKLKHAAKTNIQDRL